MTKLTFAFGDVHGCLDQLKELFSILNQRYSLAPANDHTFVFIGDYIDRGPDSKGVIDFIRDYANDHNVIPLMGNHEDMCIQISMLRSTASWWIGNGGDTTCASFGNCNPRHVPREYVEWMQRLNYYYDDGRRFFVHAGVNRKPPKDSDHETMLWVRHPFLSSSKSWGRLIVHGHTPVENVTVTPFRVNLDTGCVFSGKLSCAVFNDEQDAPIDIVQVKGYDRVKVGPLDPL